MTEAEIRKSIFKILGRIAPDAEPERIKPNDNLREALDIDSFDFLNVLISLHEELGVEIPEADYGKVKTLAGLVAYLSAKSGH